MNIKKLKLVSLGNTSKNPIIRVIEKYQDPAYQSEIGFFRDTEKVAGFEELVGVVPTDDFYVGIAGDSPEGASVVFELPSTLTGIDTVRMFVPDIEFPLVAVQALDQNDLVVGALAFDYEHDYPVFKRFEYGLTLTGIMEIASEQQPAKVRFTALGDITTPQCLSADVEVDSANWNERPGVDYLRVEQASKFFTSNAPFIENNFNASTPVDAPLINGFNALYYTSGVVPSGTYREFDLGLYPTIVADYMKFAQRHDLGTSRVRVEFLSSSGKVIGESGLSNDWVTMGAINFCRLEPEPTSFSKMSVSTPRWVDRDDPEYSYSFLFSGDNDSVVEYMLRSGESIRLDADFTSPTDLKFTTYAYTSEGYDGSILDSQTFTNSTDFSYSFTATTEYVYYITVVTRADSTMLPWAGAITTSAFPENTELVATFTINSVQTPPPYVAMVPPVRSRLQTRPEFGWKQTYSRWGQIIVSGSEPKPLTVKLVSPRLTQVSDKVMIDGVYHGFTPSVVLFDQNGHIVARSSAGSLVATVTGGTYYAYASDYNHYSSDGFAVWDSSVPLLPGTRIQVDYPQTVTLTPDSNGFTYGASLSSTFKITCLAGGYDRTFKCRVFNQDGSTITLHSAFGPAQNPTGVFPIGTDATINGGFRDGDVFRETVILDQPGQWADIVYDDVAKSFQVIGLSYPGVYHAPPYVVITDAIVILDEH